MLFTPVEILPPSNRPEHAGLLLCQFSGLMTSGAIDVAEKILPKLKSHCSMAVITEGKISAHQVLETVLKVTGPADLYFSTWTITEDPARALYNLQQSGQLKSINAIFDNRVPVHNANAYTFCKTFFSRISLAPCHAKILCVIGEKESFTVFTSANMSINPRAEFSLIINNRQLTDESVAWFEKYLDGRKTGAD